MTLRVTIRQLLLCLAPMLVLAEPSSGISDHVQFGDPASEKAHRLAVKGDVPVVTMETRSGPVSFRHVTREFRGAGAQITFRLSVPIAYAAPRVLLEIQEVHDRRAVFGYSIFAGGKKVYFRTYEEISGGPNHYFVEIDRSLIDDDGVLAVGLVGEGGAPFNISQAWVYPDFDKLVAEEAVFTKPALVLGPSPELAGVTGDFWKSRDDALRIIEGLKEKYGQCESFTLGLMSVIGYARWSQAENRKMIDHALDVSAATGVPYHFMFNTWWGGANIGPDGLGGYFSDLEYESISYDSETGRFRPSFPNQWGNSLWATKNHPHLNRVNNHRIGLAARYLADRAEAIRAAGASLPPPVIYAEWGPNYGPDYNPAAIATAAKDGVVLDPRDGLSPEEKQWTHESYGTYFAQQVPAYREALGRGHVIVSDGRRQPPAEPLIDNIYTHGFWGAGSPLHDEKQAYWQQCMNDGMWCSGELYPWYPQAYYDYILPVSRVTCVNLERAVVSDLAFMRTAYANGLGFVTFFNCKPGDEALLKAVDRLENDPNPPAAYDRRVLAVLFARDGAIGNNKDHIAHEGVELRGARVHPAQSGKVGRVVYRIADPETAFRDGLRLEVLGSCGRRDRGDGWSVKVLAGSDAVSLAPVATLRASDFGRGQRQGAIVDMSEFARGRKELVVGLELRSDGQIEEVEIRQVAAFIPWPQASGQADGSVPNLRQSRARSLWLQQRARLDRVMRDFRSRGGEGEALQKAEALRSEGRYATAWRHLTGAIATTLPARYSVRGKASLDPYPLHVAVGGTGAVVQIELLEIGSGGARFHVQADRESDVTLTFSGLRRGGRYVIQSSGPQEYRLVEAGVADTNAMIAVDGTQSHNLKALPRAVEPDFPFEPVKTVALPRRTKAKYEVETGVVRSFVPPSVTVPVGNGIVELESGNRYELGYMPWWSKLDLVGASELKSLSLESIAKAFRPGYPVTIEYEPVAFEGRAPRIIRATQPVRLLLDENYVERSEGWEARALEVKGLHVVNYNGKKLYPTRNWEAGHVIYRITNAVPLGPTAAAFTGRIILNPANRVSIFVRTGSGDWTSCADFGISTPGANNWRAQKIVDLTEWVEGRTSFDLKLEIHTMDTSWSSVGSLSVRTLDGDRGDSSPPGKKMPR